MSSHQPKKTAHLHASPQTDIFITFFFFIMSFFYIVSLVSVFLPVQTSRICELGLRHGFFWFSATWTTHFFSCPVNFPVTTDEPRRCLLVGLRSVSRPIVTGWYVADVYAAVVHHSIPVWLIHITSVYFFNAEWYWSLGTSVVIWFWSVIHNSSWSAAIPFPIQTDYTK